MALTVEGVADHSAVIAARRSMPVRWRIRRPMALRVGTIRQRAAFSPRRQIWRRSALDWVDALAAVPATERG